MTQVLEASLAEVLWDRAEFEPYLESDDEDDEEDAELICRPRTIGGVAQPRE